MSWSDKAGGNSEQKEHRCIADAIVRKISIWNRVEGDARGFRQDLRGSVDCRSRVADLSLLNTGSQFSRGLFQPLAAPDPAAAHFPPHDNATV